MAEKKKRRRKAGACSEWEHVEAAGLSMLKQAVELRTRAAKGGDGTAEGLALVALGNAWVVIATARVELAKAVR